MTRKHLKSDAKNKAQAGGDPKLLGEIAHLQGKLAKLQASTTKCDEEEHNESKKGK